MHALFAAKTPNGSTGHSEAKNYSFAAYSAVPAVPPTVNPPASTEAPVAFAAAPNSSGGDYVPLRLPRRPPRHRPHLAPNRQSSLRQLRRYASPQRRRRRIPRASSRALREDRPERIRNRRVHVRLAGQAVCAGAEDEARRCGREVAGSGRSRASPRPRRSPSRRSATRRWPALSRSCRRTPSTAAGRCADPRHFGAPRSGSPEIHNPGISIRSLSAGFPHQRRAYGFRARASRASE